MARSKVRGVEDAVGAVRSGSTVGVVGCGGGILEPDLLIRALGARYVATKQPRDLTLFHTAGLGDRRGRGLEALAQPGLVTRIIAGHYGMCPPVAGLVTSGHAEGHNLPQGVLSLLLREAAGGRSSLTTPIGLGTFVDPRFEGGRLNDRTSSDLVTLVHQDSRERLRYTAPRIDVALLRASVADEAGNVSLEDETSYLDSYEFAAAAHAVGGIVIVQAKRVVQAGTLAPKRVHVPGVLVDMVVQHTSQWQTYEAEENPAFAGQIRTRVDEAMPFDQRKVIARRAARELASGDVINLGVGVPAGVASVVAEGPPDHDVTITLEHGVIGGVTERGVLFGATVNHDAVISMASMFDFYHAGGLDTAFLGFAQVDRAGNVNVSRYGGEIVGCGGFIDISQPTGTVVFCGTLTASGTRVDFDGGRAIVVQEGSVMKFVDEVDQITFSAAQAHRNGQRVLYVTERGMFELREDGPVLVEVAPGVDVDRDIAPVLGFDPLVASNLRTYDDEVVRDDSDSCPGVPVVSGGRP